MSKLINMIGFKTGKLTVLEQSKSKYKQSMWLCKCDCGNLCTYTGGSLRKGKVKSCGCYYKETRTEIAHKTIAKKKHGDSFERLYFIWNDMKSRCNNPNDISYHNYGAKGIGICNEWLHDYIAFKNWAVNNGYNPIAERGECTLDRIDNTKGYSPDNCRWVNMKIQSNNRRNSYTITYKEKTHTASEWSKITGIPASTIYARYKAGWKPEDILSKAKYNQHHKVIGEY